MAFYITFAFEKIHSSLISLLDGMLANLKTLNLHKLFVFGLKYLAFICPFKIPV